MKDEIKDKIIEIYEKLLKIDDDIISVNSSLSYVDSFSTNAIKLENERDFLYEKFKDLKSELASLKSQLSEAGEEDLDRIALMKKYSITEADVTEYLKQFNKEAGKEKGNTRVCLSCGTPVSDYCEKCQHLWES